MTRILIVDDDEINRHLLRATLRSRGYKTNSAGDGAEALEKARRDPPDVIISDILMPVMDGFALCREWKQDDVLKTIPFIYYTAIYTGLRDKVFAQGLGAERFIIKPAEPDEIVKVLEEVLQERETKIATAPHEPVEEETVYLKEYNEVLILKLEEKMAELEETNRALKLEIAERMRAEEVLEEYSKRLEEMVEERTAELKAANEQLRREISERERAEEIIKHLAYHDALTNLPNRRMFNDRLTMALAHAQRNRQKLALMLLDLDYFKKVNDTLGHSAGDKLLQVVGERLASSLRRSDTVARMGGDEFMLILPGINRMEDAANVANKILDTFCRPFEFDNHRLHVTTSIGIAIFPDDGQNAEDLMRNADVAMYGAKEQGRNNYQHYTLAMKSNQKPKNADRKLGRGVDKKSESLVIVDRDTDTPALQPSRVNADVNAL